jgi:hypothetical protein
MKQPKVAITFGVIVGSLFTDLLWFPNGPDRYSLAGVLVAVILLATFWEDMTRKKEGGEE